MITISDKGTFIFRGQLMIENADRLSPEEINKRLERRPMILPIIMEI